MQIQIEKITQHNTQHNTGYLSSNISQKFAKVLIQESAELNSRGKNEQVRHNSSVDSLEVVESFSSLIFSHNLIKLHPELLDLNFCLRFIASGARRTLSGMDQFIKPSETF